MNEIWKDIVGYEGQYQVSNLGNIISLNYGRSGKPHLMKPTITHDGYYRVHIGGKKHPLMKTVHILVAKAFIPNPDNKPQVNHIDGDKTNNCVTNLEWVTGKENIHHAIVNGLRKPDNHVYLKGEHHYASKPVVQYDLNGNYVKLWQCQSDAARFLNCKSSSIVNCLNSPTKSCKGYYWRTPSTDIPQKIEVRKHHLSPRIIRQYSVQGELLREWDSFKEIMSENPSYKASSLSACCSGAQKTAYGYRWVSFFIN